MRPEWLLCLPGHWGSSLRQRDPRPWLGARPPSLCSPISPLLCWYVSMCLVDVPAVACVFGRPLGGFLLQACRPAGSPPHPRAPGTPPGLTHLLLSSPLPAMGGSAGPWAPEAQTPYLFPPAARLGLKIGSRGRTRFTGQAPGLNGVTGPPQRLCPQRGGERRGLAARPEPRPGLCPSFAVGSASGTPPLLGALVYKVGVKAVATSSGWRGLQ